MKQTQPNLLLIGCGSHAKRVYFPALKATENLFGTKIKAIIELKEKKVDVSSFVANYYSNIESIYIDPFDDTLKHSLPTCFEQRLNKIVKDKKINGVVIATDPLNHMQYALWAQKQGLHILMDKPVSTYSDVSTSVESAKQIKKDFKLLIANYSPDKAFIVNAHRRFLPQFEIIQNIVNEVARVYGMPVTSMQSTHCDGQWRLPNEVLTMTYHPSLGYGKVSHSGYHFIDMASKIIKDSFVHSQKQFNTLSAYSKFIYPSGILMQQSQKDLANIFGENYSKLDPRSDAEIFDEYKKRNEAEIDATALINFSCHGVPMTNLTLNLIHNGFTRRSWMLPKKDLYKGNGRLRHEYHNIQQGPLQNIQIHSYQSKDKHDVNNEDDFEVGGNNHYDIYIFRNKGIIGGKLFEVITAKDIANAYKLDKTKVMNELARHEAVKEFLNVIIGNCKGSKTKGNITDHQLTTQLMSMIYESSISCAEVTQIFSNNYQSERQTMAL